MLYLYTHLLLVSTRLYCLIHFRKKHDSLILWFNCCQKIIFLKKKKNRQTPLLGIVGWLNPVLPRGVRSCYPHPSQGLELWGLPVVGVTGYELTTQAHPTPSLEQPEMKRG